MHSGTAKAEQARIDQQKEKSAARKSWSSSADQPATIHRPASPAGKTATHVSASTATKGDAASGHDDDQSMQPPSGETEGANDDDDYYF